MRLVVGALGICAGLLVSEAEAVPAPPMRYVPAHSSNYSARSSRTINMIVIHTIEGSEAGGISWFQNRRSNVSAHYVVAHSGRITRMVADKNVAWHVRNYNSRSIGIENEGYAQRNTWTSAQMSNLAKLVAYLCDKYRIPVDRSHIRSHAELDPSRRSDPGPYFNWSRFMTLVRNGGSAGGGSTGGGSTGSTGGGSTGGGSTTLNNAGAVEVSASRLNVRTRPWGTVLGSVGRGDSFVLTGAADGPWRQIHFRGRAAWVHGDYLRSVGGTGLKVTASALNVRTGASTRNARIGQVARNQRYVQRGSSGSWRRLQYDDRTGWAHGNYMTPVRLGR